MFAFKKLCSVRYGVRPMVLKFDTHPVLEADLTSFVDHLDEDSLQFMSRQNTDNIVAVCVDTESVDGYLISPQRKDVLRILRMCVHASRRRRGAGTVLIDSMLRNMCKSTKIVEIVIPENYDNALKFFRSRGFYAESIYRDECAEQGDCILMRYRKDGEYRFQWRS
jgi:ribosomal protein S18 acetylase RimI-like enzyme